MYDFDPPGSNWQDPADLIHGLLVNGDGEVTLDLEYCLRYVQVETADDVPDATSLDGRAVDGISYRLEAVQSRIEQKRVFVDGRSTLITVDPGAMTLQVDLLQAPEGSTFFNTRYNVATMARSTGPSSTAPTTGHRSAPMDQSRSRRDPANLLHHTVSTSCHRQGRNPCSDRDPVLSPRRL